MNDQKEYDIQYYDDQFKSWMSCYYLCATLGEAKKGLAQYNYLYTREKHRIVMRKASGWCEVKE